MSESNRSQTDRPGAEQGAPKEHRFLHGVSVQGTVRDFWDAQDSIGIASPKACESGKWQHLRAASLISDLRAWKRGRTGWLSHAVFHPTVKPLVFIPSGEGRFSFADLCFEIPHLMFFLTLRAAAKQQRTQCLPLEGEGVQQPRSSLGAKLRRGVGAVGSSLQHGPV